ncbi:cell division protein FtsX [Halovulum sp. GXIMD14793]
MAEITTLLRGDVAADQVVPPSGGTARLTIFAAAAMGFLAVLAVLLALSASRIAGHWQDALSGVATVELPAANDTDLAKLLTVLDTTPGVTNVQEIGPARQRALLEPWLGPDFPVEALSLPRLVELRTDASFDAESLRLRLEGELPRAVFVPRSDLQDKVAGAAGRLGWIGWLALVITAFVMASIITLAASAALAANERVIETLRLLGAQDDFIARAFVRRFTLRGAAGAAVGVLAGIAVMLLLVLAGTGAIAPLLPGPLGWILILLIPVFAGIIAFVATRRSARVTLSRLT